MLRNLSRTLVAIEVPQGAHHLDLMFSHPEDPPPVRAARDAEFALLREFSRAKMMDCKEEEDAGGSPGKGLGTGLSPFKWRLNEPCCSLSPSGNCNAVRAKDAPGGAAACTRASAPTREVYR